MCNAVIPDLSSISGGALSCLSQCKLNQSGSVWGTPPNTSASEHGLSLSKRARQLIHKSKLKTSMFWIRSSTDNSLFQQTLLEHLFYASALLNAGVRAVHKASTAPALIYHAYL